MNDTFGSLEFGDLPLIEVAARIVLEQDLPDLGLGRVLKLVQALARKFPVVEDSPSLEMAPPGKMMKIAPGSLMAVNFIADPPDARLTLQRNLIRWVWARTIQNESKNALAYPRYARIREELSMFADLVGSIFFERPLTVKSVNMGYTNFISTAGKSTGETAGRYLAKSINSAIMESSPTVHEISLNWRTASGLDRKVQFSAGRSTGGSEKVEGYILTTNAGGFLGSQKNPIQLLDEVHLDLQDFFLSILSEQAKKEWEYVERG